MGTLCRAGARAPDLRGHWVYKGEDGVGSVLVLRLRQNQAPNPAGAVHSTPSPLQARGEAGWRCHSTPGAGWGRSRAGPRLVATGCRASWDGVRVSGGTASAMYARS